MPTVAEASAPAEALAQVEVSAQEEDSLQEVPASDQEVPASEQAEARSVQVEDSPQAEQALDLLDLARRLAQGADLPLAQTLARPSAMPLRTTVDSTRTRHPSPVSVSSDSSLPIQIKTEKKSWERIYFIVFVFADVCSPKRERMFTFASFFFSFSFLCDPPMRLCCLLLTDIVW